MIKRILYGTSITSLVIAAYLIGSLSLGRAQAQTATPPSSATEQATTLGKQELAAEKQEAAEANEADQQSEADEAKALASQATISAEQAQTAALAQFPGATVHQVKLDDENGTVVYSVELTDASGQGHDVKVDATNGTVVKAEADGAEDQEDVNSK